MRAVPTRYVRPSGNRKRTRNPLAMPPPRFRNVNDACTVMPGSIIRLGLTSKVRSPSGNSGPREAKTSDSVRISPDSMHEEILRRRQARVTPCRGSPPHELPG